MTGAAHGASQWDQPRAGNQPRAWHQPRAWTQPARRGPDQRGTSRERAGPPLHPGQRADVPGLEPDRACPGRRWPRHRPAAAALPWRPIRPGTWWASRSSCSGAVLAIAAYADMMRNQRALRRGEPLPRSVLPRVLAVTIGGVATVGRHRRPALGDQVGPDVITAPAAPGHRSGEPDQARLDPDRGRLRRNRRGHAEVQPGCRRLSSCC